MSKSGSKNKSSSSPAPGPSKDTAAENNAMDAGSMDKIRDILFGNQVRDFERRFSRMEEQMTTAVQELRDEVQKQVGALELFFKEEMGALKERQKSENDLRQQDLEKLAETLKSTAGAINKTISQNNDQFAERTTELRQQILDQSKQLSADIKTKYEQAAREIKQVASGLDEAKVDRSTLAEYLIQLAMGLSSHSETAVSQRSEQKQ